MSSARNWRESTFRLSMRPIQGCDGRIRAPLGIEAFYNPAGNFLPKEESQSTQELLASYAVPLMMVLEEDLR